MVDGIFDLLVVPLVCYVLWLLAVSVHEIGHALVAACLGLRILRFRVGPFMLTKSVSVSHAKAWKLRREGKKWTSGEVAMRVGDLRLTHPVLRFAVATAAGPMTSLLAALLSSAVAEGPRGIAALAFQAFAGFNFMIALGTALPARTRSGRGTDGRQIWLACRKNTRHVILAQLTVIARFQELRKRFEAVDRDSARVLLTQLQADAKLLGGSYLQQIFQHIEAEHIETMTPLEDCKWEPSSKPELAEEIQPA
jgi:hypothetical protein